MNATTPLQSNLPIEDLDVYYAKTDPADDGLVGSEVGASRAGRDRMSIDLCGYGYSLKEHAAKLGISPAALLRQTMRGMFGPLERKRSGNAGRRARPTGPIVKVTLRLSASHAASLATRAREADVAQGIYMEGLLDGLTPPPASGDHATAVDALMKSTDHLAAMSADLNSFMRLLGRDPSGQFDPLRDSVRTLHKDVRTHLVSSAALMAELKPPRKAKR